MKGVVLKKGRERSLQRRHPWVFSGALESVPDDFARAGELVCVRDAGQEVLGAGWYSPASQIRVRLLSFGAETDFSEDVLLRQRVAAAANRRTDLLASGETDAVRLVNAENDGLPGVVADCYAGWIVCQFTSAGAEERKDMLVQALLSACPSCRGVSERRDIDSRRKEGLPVEPAFRVLSGDAPPELIEIREGPCRFLVDVRKGHKTGFYLDQREARATVAAFARGREVLNCFAYTGGFGLAARQAGAAKVTQVDISDEALALARRNEALQPAAATEMEYVSADVFQYLRKCRDQGRSFDLIVLDPPKFAAVKSQLMKAARGYKDINLLAMKLLRPNGLLATFSCSSAMEPELFDKVLAEAAADARRDFQVVTRMRQGADHPVSLSFPEGHYLKGVVLRKVN